MIVFRMAYPQTMTLAGNPKLPRTGLCRAPRVVLMHFSCCVATQTPNRWTKLSEWYFLTAALYLLCTGAGTCDQDALGCKRVVSAFE